MPLSQGDNQFRVNWPNNTTPQAPDGSGTSRVTLCGFGLTNTAASVRFVRFYDTATSPTVGSTAPKRVCQVPANSSLYVEFQRGKTFLNGLWMSVTTLAADSDNTAPAAGDILATVDWQ